MRTVTKYCLPGLYDNFGNIHRWALKRCQGFLTNFEFFPLFFVLINSVYSDCLFQCIIDVKTVGGGDDYGIIPWVLVSWIPKRI